MLSGDSLLLNIILRVVHAVILKFRSKRQRIAGTPYHHTAFAWNVQENMRKQKLDTKGCRV